MRHTRVYTDHKLLPGQEVILGKAVAHYLSRVLRLAVNEPVILFNGDGSDYPAAIETFHKNQVRLSVRQRQAAVKESPLKLTLGLAVSRGERMDYSLQKSTELGVRLFQPLISERVEVKLKGVRLAKRMDHWRAVIISACEQSGRAKLPELLPLMNLDEWLEQAANPPRLVLQPGADQSIYQLSNPLPAVELLVGPEGGFTIEEISKAKENGFLTAGIGNLILRAETVPISVLTILQYEAGNLGFDGALL